MIRERNEDSCMVPEVEAGLLRERGYLFAVADGMGGYGDGHKASQLSLQTLYASYYGPTATSLPEAIQHAHMAVRRLAMRPENDARLGTTLVAALFHERTILVAHIGDSRAYVVRGAAIWQVTSDHSAQGQLGAGGHVVTRALGQHEGAAADYTPVSELMRGDIMVLCSDGLTNLVDDQEILRAVAAHAPQRAADSLVELANRRGGHDNVTVQVIRVNGLPFCPPPADAGPGLPRISARTLSLFGALLLIVVALGALLLVRL